MPVHASEFFFKILYFLLQFIIIDNFIMSSVYTILTSRDPIMRSIMMYNVPTWQKPNISARVEPFF